MKTILVQAQKDHIASLCTASPIQALSELIWNALDADAFDVRVDVIQNALGGVDAIRVADDGQGINVSDVDHCFGYLGGSWKRNATQTPIAARMIHGRKGKGRFKAFSLGNHVEWRTTVQTDSGLKSYVLGGSAANPGEFDMTEAATPGPATGTEVMIQELPRDPSSLLDAPWVVEQLASQFALYLKAYPNVRLYFQGLLVDPLIVQRSAQTYRLKASTGYEADLKVIEWKTRQGRGKIIFCNPDGFALHETEAAVRPGSGFNYTAYLISPRFTELQEENVLELEELHPEIKAFLDSTRELLRVHFRERREAITNDLLKQWQTQGVYPYPATPPKNDDDAFERKQFDACALAIRAASETFDQLSQLEKHVVFGLLKAAVAQDPKTAIARVADLLGVPIRLKKK